MAGEPDLLVIFDCDGVLVDSEPIALSVLAEMLERQGLKLDGAAVSDRFLGRSLGAVTAIVREEFDIRLPDDFAAIMRRRLFERYDTELCAIDGIRLVLDALDEAGVAVCVASSSLPERIEKSLSVTGLLSRFAPRIFSASMVKAGKPAPDLFLHAARQLGFAPAHCLVIEDSPAGIEAAKAAGMRVFAFGGGGHAVGPEFRARIAALNPDAWFDAMPELLQLVARVRSSEINLHE
jgi:HAD superfamily hydrolase (TIGR01509 family)